MDRAVIYVRVSSLGQDEDGGGTGTSLASQEKEAREYCQEHGYRVAGFHSDTHTGQDFWERPGIQAALRDIAEGRAEVLICHTLDRLGRDTRHQGHVLSVLQQHGARLELVKGKVEDTAEGRFLLAVAGYMAENELEKIRERTVRGRRTRAERGSLMVGGTPLYGYTWMDDEPGKRTAYVIDPETAPIVVRIYEEIAAGRTNAKIAEGLNRDGIPTPSQVLQARGQWGRGRKVAPVWTGDGIYGIASNPSYAGKHSAFNSQKIKGRGLRKAGVTVRFQVRAADDKVRIALPSSACPRLIDEATYQKVHAVMATNKLRAARRNSDPDATMLRGGYAVCGYCGHALTVHRRSDGSGRVYYCKKGSSTGPDKCRGGTYSIAAHVLDPAVDRALLQVKRDRPLFHEVIMAAIRKVSGEHASVDGKLRTVDATVKRLTEHRDSLLDSIKMVTSATARASLSQSLDAVSLDLDKALAEREEVRGENQEVRDQEALLDEVAANVVETLHDGRQMLERLGIRVKVYRTDDEAHPKRFELYFLAFKDGDRHGGFD